MVSDERGQLILVGAVAIALVLLGLVLVVNTALFTQVVGSEGTVETTREGSLAAGQIGRAVAAAVAEENRDGGGISSIESDVDDRVDNDLDPQLRTRSVESGSAFTSVEFEGETVTGSRIHQEDYGTLTDASGSSTWHPLPSSDPGDVGRFVLTINVTTSAGGDTFTVFAEGDSVSPLNRSLDIDVDTSSDEVDLATPETTCSNIEATQGTVRVDITNGRVLEDSSCQFDLFGPPEPPYALTFSQGDEVTGTYELTTDQESGIVGLAIFDSADDQPTRDDAIWAFEYSYEYDTGDATVESDSHEVEVYD